MTPDPISSRDDFLFPINKESSAPSSHFDSSQSNSHHALYVLLSVLTESESQHRRAERAELLATACSDHEA